MNISQESQIFEKIIQIVAPHSKLIRLWPLKGGLSAEMLAIEIEASAGQKKKFIIRQFDEAASEPKLHPLEYEFMVLKIAQSYGLTVPTPYHFDPSGKYLAGPYMILNYIEGEMDFCPVDLNKYLLALATELSKIHTPGEHDLSFLKKVSDVCLELERKRPSPTPPACAEARIRTTLTARGPQPQQNESTLLHGDFWPGNTLWLDGELTAVIDWEDAKWGDPLIDLANSRLEIAWIFGPEAMNTFTRYYQSRIALDYTNLPYWDLCAALRFIRIFADDLQRAAAFFTAYGRHDITPRTILDNYIVFINQAFAALS